jgi:pimeloyl-ACP methyl ester carboxylesterase
MTDGQMGSRRLKLAAAAALTLAAASCAPGLMPDFIDAMKTAKFQPVGAGDDAVKLAVHESGAGKPIVLIHGLGASSYTWSKIAPELARTHRVIAIDLKGFGQSDKPLDANYSIFDQARLIEDYIARNKLTGVTLVGHSYGGGVALAAALDAQDAGSRRIARLVLIDSIAYRQPMPFFFQVLRTPVLGEIGMSVIPPEVQAARALAIAYHENSKVTPEAVSHYASALYSEGGRHALLQTINSLDPQQAEDFSARYKELKLPTLLLWCELDKIVPLKYGKRLAADLPDVRIEVIEDCGHIPHEEQPEQTLTALKTFLSY